MSSRRDRDGADDENAEDGASDEPSTAPGRADPAPLEDPPFDPSADFDPQDITLTDRFETWPPDPDGKTDQDGLVHAVFVESTAPPAKVRSSRRPDPEGSKAGAPSRPPRGLAIPVLLGLGAIAMFVAGVAFGVVLAVLLL